MSQKARAESELLALLGLGGGLPERLVATVAAAWKERLRQTREAARAIAGAAPGRASRTGVRRDAQLAGSVRPRVATEDDR